MQKFLATALVVMLPAVGWADEMQQQAVVGRHGYFTMLGLEMEKLAPVVKGGAEYDAAVAQSAADNLAALGSYDVTALFVDGTANGSYEDSAALPEIWKDPDDFHTKYEALKTATADLATVAGDGKDAMVAAFVKVSGTCRACHGDYRAKGM